MEFIQLNLIINRFITLKDLHINLVNLEGNFHLNIKIFIRLLNLKRSNFYLINFIFLFNLLFKLDFY